MTCVLRQVMCCQSRMMDDLFCWPCNSRVCVLQEAAELRDELACEYDKRAEAAGRQKQQLDL